MNKDKIFLELINNLEYKRQMFIAGSLHSDEDFITIIQKLQNYIPCISNYRIKEQINNFVDSVLKHKNYKYYQEKLKSNKLKLKQKDEALKLVKEIKLLQMKNNIDESSCLFKNNKEILYHNTPEFYQEFNSSILRIIEILKNKKIKYLIHFTNIKNLENILKLGLLPRETLEKENIKFFCSDISRMDGKKDCTCLSIEYPNYKMLNNKKYWSDKYIILLLDAKSILVNTYDKYFVYINAATNFAIKHLQSDKLTNVDYFKAMFNDKVSDTRFVYSRNEDIPSYIPTNPQAEILLKGPVQVDDILEVHFQTSEDYEQFKFNCTDKKYLNMDKFRVSNYYFQNREDVNWNER